MDQLLFYHYLNYQKNRYPSFFKKVSHFPLHIRFFLFITLAASVMSIGFYFSKHIIESLISIAIAFICCECLSRFVESYRIKTSTQGMAQRIEDWKALRNWLNANFIKDIASILIIKQRIEKTILELKAKQQESNLRLETRIQTLAVPVVLAIITAVINQKNALETMLAMITLIILVCILIYMVICIIRNIYWFNLSQKITKMMAFAEDLQGVLDLDQFNLLSIDTAESKQINTDNR